jgi:AcrR family transcriptional regulator
VADINDALIYRYFPDKQAILTARAYFGALIAFVLLQDQLGMASIRPVDTAEYIHHLAQLTIHGTGLPRKQQPAGAGNHPGTRQCPALMLRHDMHRWWRTR